MPGHIDHGPRLSGSEFDRMVADVYLQLPDQPTTTERRQAERREFELTIDHRLGIHFPQERRDALWSVNQQMKRHPIRMLLAWRIGKFLPRYLAALARRLSSTVIDEYRAVLSPQELERFFGEDELASPGLPIDPSTLDGPR